MRMTALVIGTVALWLSGCASVQRPPTAADAGAELARQILVTTLQTPSPALGLVGDPATLYLRRPVYGPAPGVDRLLNQIAVEFDLERVDGWLISSLGVYCEVYELGPGQDRDEILRRLRLDPRIESVQTMNAYATEAVRYDDPYAPMQPALGELSIDLAHEIATGRGVTIAVIDSMVDGNHPEMRGRVSLRRDLVPGGSPARRAEVHGTAVAGVIASRANNSEGIVGVAPDARIESLRACWTVDETSGRAMCSSFSLAKALEAALLSGADVINMSLSGPRDPLVERLVDLAIGDGVIVVAALSEDSSAAAEFPASHPGVIAAGSPGIAMPPNGNVLSAPAREIISTSPGSSYAFFSGNSMSSAFVAGVAALLVEQQPEMTGDEVYRLLAETSSPDSINACRAVARLNASSECEVPADVDTANDREE